MASISYWFLSPSVILALIGKLRGWERTKPTPTFDWKTATLDVLIPAKNEESRLTFALHRFSIRTFGFARHQPALRTGFPSGGEVRYVDGR